MWTGRQGTYVLPDTLYDDLVAQLLANRDIDNHEEFLQVDYRQIADPFVMHDMQIAVDRIMQAMQAGQKIAVYADYDADGIPGAVVLHDFFTMIGYQVEVYIPHRHDEGYGLHIDAIDSLAADGTQLIITVDLGIRAVAAVAHARELGVDIVITDHHEPGDELPEAIAVVNPKLGTYPDPMLCGAAVAWQLARALAQRIESEEIEPYQESLQPGWDKWSLDMVGIATISDMVPLVNENRILALYGLLVLRKTKRIGLRALYRATRLRAEHIIETDVGFTLGPRINAASRMSHPRRAFELFIADSAATAADLVQHLEDSNKKRKKETATIMRSVHKRLAGRELGPVVVIGDEDWSQGVLGLVASKIVDEYERPAFVWSQNGSGVLKGSCRATPGVDCVGLMSQLPEGTLVNFGGHEGAGGFSITKEEIHFLEERLGVAYQELYPNGLDASVTHTIDGELRLDQVARTTYQNIRKLGPFGVGNKEPLFLIQAVTVSQVRQFGKGKEHLEIVFGQNTKAIAFFTKPEDFVVSIQSGEQVSAVVTVERNLFAGRDEIRLRLVDVVQPQWVLRYTRHHE